MNAADVHNAGGSMPHNNLPPFLSVYFVIRLQGIYPPRR
jgi:microcystin-dependent protein